MLNICVVGSPIITYCFKDACNYLTSALDVGTSVVLRTWLHDVMLTKIKTILSLLIWVKVSYIYTRYLYGEAFKCLKKKFFRQFLSLMQTNLLWTLAFKISYIFELFLVTYAMSEIQNELILLVCTKIICTLRFHLQKRIFILVFRGVLYMKLS